MSAARRDLKKALYEQQHGLCAYCDEPMTWLSSPNLATLDHIIPLKNGGADDATNSVLACHQCNRCKGSLTPERLRKLADKVEKLTRWAEAQKALAAERAGA